MKQILSFSFLFLLVTVVLSWKKPAASNAGPGQPVTRDQYQPCLDSFVAVMGRYGIQPGAPVKNPSCPAMTYPITTYESFQASGLLSWMQAEVAKWDATGKGANLDFQMRFGILTPTFVSSLGQPDSLVGRIAVFVIPAFRDGTAAAAKARTSGTLGDDPGRDGYELGGLHP